MYENFDLREIQLTFFTILAIFSAHIHTKILTWKKFYELFMTNFEDVSPYIYEYRSKYTLK